MIKFETFIFKNGKTLDLYSKDGKRTNKGKDIYVDARQTADVLTVKAFRVKEWAARNNIAFCDKLDASVESRRFRLSNVSKKKTPDNLSGVGVKPVVNKQKP